MSEREISSLLEDIDILFNQGRTPSETNLTLLKEGIAESVIQVLSEVRDTTGKMRLSSIGKKDRQLWYDYNGHEKEPLPTATCEFTVVLAANADLPTAVLEPAVVFAPPARLPINVFSAPVLIAPPARKPSAVLLLDVVHAVRAALPTATF